MAFDTVSLPQRMLETTSGAVLAVDGRWIRGILAGETTLADGLASHVCEAPWSAIMADTAAKFENGPKGATQKTKREKQKQKQDYEEEGDCS
jgi:hypothetical protein